MNVFSTNNGIGTGTPATSAILDLTAPDKALLLTRLSDAQRDALTPVAGMIIYNTTSGTLQVRGASAWLTVTAV
jgi:hypothetical protein